MNNIFDVMDFGAVPDGATDCTGSFQKALDAAGEVMGTVIIPPGDYACNRLKVHSRTCVMGYDAWAYKNVDGYHSPYGGGSSIRLLSGDNTCLLDISHSIGVTIRGLCLNGRFLGENVCGILLDNADVSKEEDTPRIEHCKIGNFTGDGIKLYRIWCFTIRHCMVHGNHGSGLHIGGYDGFVLDNWFSSNEGFGILADGWEANGTITATGNRIEWNALGGIYIVKGILWNIVNNYFDRAGGPALYIADDPEVTTRSITVTGNIFSRSGAPLRGNIPARENTHVLFDHCFNIVFTSNILSVGRDDTEDGVFSPDHGMVIRKLKNSVIKDNVGQDACVKQFILDLGEHGDNVTIKDNMGGPVKDITSGKSKLIH